MSDLLITGGVFVAGLLLGALLNIIIIRLPRERNMLGWPRCTRTGEPLAFWQVLPVLGWLLQRGRTRDGRALHWVYPLVELLTAAVVATLYVQHGFSRLFFFLVLVCAVLIVVGTIDWLYRWIYTIVVLGMVPVIILSNLFVLQLNLFNAVLGALAGGILFIILFMLGRMLFPSKSVPFGMGDVYLGIFIGAAVGLTNLGPSLIYGIFMAGAVSAGIVFARRVLKRQTPEYISYGTYLCLGAILYVISQGIT